MTSRPFTPDTLAALREEITSAITFGVNYSCPQPEKHADIAGDIIALLTPLLDATHEAACRAMREEAAKVAIEVAKHPFGYSGSSAAYRIAADIHALHLPKREG